ncbi:SLC13 family permease [Fusibacter ferrireducens]|uniref:Sodium-dependent dicarboxylate transporter SdcS n=1 Tax=Fusibacter ferrireducens TaxID=2785058 RepID=A0ABR9ZPD8_9FIRM|nr:SLC13 family permease [Fusibacter ferrireducens]MBF4692181.1 SLC13 family permease [Fusibacter ferrireducens]
MNLRLDRSLILKILMTLILPISIVIVKPLGMSLFQSIVLGTLFLTVTWWATGCVNKEFASILMLLIFSVFGDTSLKNIYFFPLSHDFVTIIASFILSQGIVNSKVADRFSKYVLNKFCKNSKALVLMSFVLGIVFIFIIPQPFPRVIILASIYASFLKNQNITEEENQVLIFSIFLGSTVTSMMFLNGDLILNYMAIEFAGISMSQLEWMKYMLFPTFLTSIILCLVYIFTFKNFLHREFILHEAEPEKISRKEAIATAIMMLVVVFWITENIHGISAMYVSLSGVLLMFIFGVIRIKDLSTININLMLFLTAAFSIGKVLTGSGISSILSNYFLTFFPPLDSVIYLPFVLLLIVVIHAMFGSTITALSVVTPTLIGITNGVFKPEFIALLGYVAVSIQYLLPFHHVTILIGFGNGYYKNAHVIKMGISLTIILPPLIFGIFMPWWRFMGL